MPTITVRPFTPTDRDAVRALDARVQPYRPGDEAEVEAMHARSAAARRDGRLWTGDRHAPYGAADDPISGYEHLWLAWIGDEPVEALAGIIAAKRCAAVGPELAGVEGALDWPALGDVAELHHLRVAPEYWRQGAGRRLVETVIEWARGGGFRLLVLNTTTPQWPAKRLYEATGFREIGVSYLDRYEFVWYAVKVS